jgi:hypothetical protein
MMVLALHDFLSANAAIGVCSFYLGRMLRAGRT